MSKFVLTAQLQLQAPTNTRQVINQLRRELEGLDVSLNVTGGPDATRQIKEVTKRTREATTAADKMGKAFGASIKKFAAFNIATRAVGLLASKLSSAVDEAIEFQRQLVKISQVTGKTTGKLASLTQEITRLSTTLGVSSTSLLQTTRVLAQAGIKAGDLQVALEALAKTTLAPTFDDITQTAEGAVAILAQFGEGVGALERQLGAINAVSKQFAVESGDLISSVRRMGGVFKSAGGDLNELLALFTSVRATTRENAESIATGLRTIFTRIQRPTTIAYLKQLGVELTDINGKFVGPYEAVRRLSQAFAEIPAGDLRFVRIAEELGGFRQIGKVIPLIQQFTIAERARQAAIAGGDSLNKDAITAQQALAVQIEKTREKFLALIRGISETSSFQIMVKSLLGMANAFIKVAESIKPLIPLITIFAGIKLAKGIGGFARGLGAGVRGKNQGGKIHAFASGGSVPGTGNRDTVPAMLTPGEFVIRKSSVKKIGAGTLAAMNENKYAGGGKAERSNIVTVGRNSAAVQDLIYRDKKTVKKDSKTEFRSSGDKSHQFTEKDTVGTNITTSVITPQQKVIDRLDEKKQRELFNFADTSKQGLAFEDYLRESKRITSTEANTRFSGTEALDGSKGSELIEVKRSKVSKTVLIDKLLRDQLEHGDKIKNQALSGGGDDVTLPNLTQISLDKEGLQALKLKNKEVADRKPQQAFLSGSGASKAPRSELFFGGPMRYYTNGNKVEPLSPSELTRYKSLNSKSGRLSPQESKDKKALGIRFNDKEKGGVLKQKEVDSGRSYGAAYLEKVTSPKGGKSSITFGKKKGEKGSKGKEEVKVNYDLNHAFLDPKDGQKIKDEFVTPKALSAINNTANHLAGLIGESIANSDNIPNLQAITGSIFEAGLARVSKEKLDIDGDDKRTFDFAGGLKGAAEIFGADGAKLRDIKTDAKVASTSSAVDSIRKKVKQDLEGSRKVLGFAKGGSIPSSDTVPAMLTPGEFVINKKSSQKIGYANLNRMNKQGAVGFANGGPVGLFDSDYIGGGRKDKSSILASILQKGSVEAAIWGPAGSGKSTLARSRYGSNLVESPEDVDKYDSFAVLSGSGATKKGSKVGKAATRFSEEAAKSFASAAKIIAVLPNNLELANRRRKRINSDIPSGDKRSKKQLIGTKQSPGTDYSLAAELKRFGKPVEIVGGDSEKSKKMAEGGGGVKNGPRLKIKGNASIPWGFGSVDKARGPVGFTGGGDVKNGPRLKIKGNASIPWGFGSVDKAPSDKKAKPKSERKYGKIILNSSGSSVSASYADGGPATGEVWAKKSYDSDEDINFFPDDNPDFVPRSATSDPSLYIVASSMATKGYGPRLYDAVMEKVTEKGGKLTSDRSSVSNDAHKVWKHYFTKRPDVRKTPLKPGDWYSGRLFDQKKFASADPKTWPPHSDPSWTLLTGYSKSPSIIKDSTKVQQTGHREELMMAKGGAVQKFGRGGKSVGINPSNPRQRSAVYSYTKDSSDINFPLSKGKELDDENFKTANDLDNISEKIPKQVYSGIGMTRIALIEKQVGRVAAEAIGKSFSFPGFLSTTSSRSEAETFITDALLEITTKGKGIKVRKGEGLHDNEEESILPRNSKFRINSVSSENKSLGMPDLLIGSNIAVQQLAKGGSVGTDTVPAMLTPGEFVINKKASESIGYGNLNRMNKQGVVGFASGGAVGFELGGGATKQQAQAIITASDLNEANKVLVDGAKHANDLVVEAFKVFPESVQKIIQDTFQGVQMVSGEEGYKKHTGREDSLSAGTKGRANLAKDASSSGIVLKEGKATVGVAKHEATHVGDQALGTAYAEQGTGEKGQFASQTPGTFQFDIVEKIKPHLVKAWEESGKSSDQISGYLADNREIFANFGAHASPAVAGILGSLDSSEVSMAKLQKVLAEEGDTFAGLGASDLEVAAPATAPAAAATAPAAAVQADPAKVAASPGSGRPFQEEMEKDVVGINREIKEQERVKAASTAKVEEELTNPNNTGESAKTVAKDAKVQEAANKKIEELSKAREELIEILRDEKKSVAEATAKNRKKNVRIAPTERAGHGAIEDVVAARTPVKAAAVAKAAAAPAAAARKSDPSAMRASSSKKASAKKDDCKCEMKAAADCKCEYEAAQRIAAAILQSTNKLIVAIQKGGGGTGGTGVPDAPTPPMEPIAEAEKEVKKRRKRKVEESIYDKDENTGDKKEDEGGFSGAQKLLLMLPAVSATLAQFADETTEAGKTILELNDGLMAMSVSAASVWEANKNAISVMDGWVKVRDDDEKANKKEQKTAGVDKMFAEADKVSGRKLSEEGFDQELESSSNKWNAELRTEGLETTEAGTKRAEDDARTRFEAANKAVEDDRRSPSAPVSSGSEGDAAREAAAALNEKLAETRRELEAAAEANREATEATAANRAEIEAETASITEGRKKSTEGAKRMVAADKAAARAQEKLNKALAAAPTRMKKLTTSLMRGFNKIQKGAANVAAIGTALISMATSVMSSIDKASKRREESAMKSGDFEGAREELQSQQDNAQRTATLNAAAQGAMLGSIFGPLGTIIGGLIGAILGWIGVIGGVSDAEKEKQKEEQNQKIADASIVKAADQTADIEKAFSGKGGSPLRKGQMDGATGKERREIAAKLAGEASAAAGKDVKRIKDPKERQKREDKLAAQELQTVGVLAGRAESEEEAIASIEKFDDGVGATRKELIRAAKTAYALSVAQKALAEANYDSLKLTSTFNAANTALKNFVGSVDGSASALDSQLATLEASQNNIGIDAGDAIDGITEKLQTSVGGANTKGGQLIQKQADIAKAGNTFGLQVEKNLKGLELNKSDSGKARSQLEEALVAAGGGADNIDPAMKAIISAEVSKIKDENVGDVDLSAVIARVKNQVGEMSKGFKEAAKALDESNKIILQLTQKRREAELQYIAVQKQSIATQLEAAKIIEEFGGEKVTPEDRKAASMAQFNLGATDAGVGGLTTGSGEDIANVGNQIAAELQNQIAKGATPGGFGSQSERLDGDKRKELQDAQKELINFAKQRAEQLKEELEIVQKKNKLEKDALEKAISGDIEGFLKGQAAAGAASAIRSGNQNMMGMFGGEAMGTAFQDAKSQGLPPEELAKFAKAALATAGITDNRSVGVLSGSTPEEQRIMDEGRRVGEAMGGVAQQTAEVANMQVEAANVVINAATLKRDETLQNMSQRLAGGGPVYANRGIFVPRGTDTVPAMLTPGEFVVNRASVQRGNNLAILQAMNKGQQAAPGPAMNRGGSVRYYNKGEQVAPGGGGFSISPETVTSLNNAFSGFSTAVDKLVGMQLSVKLDATNVNVNFSGTSFLGKLTDTIREEVLKEVKNQIPNISQNTSGGNEFQQGVL